jgi:hypothetical protein
MKIATYSNSEEGKAFVHANCVFEAELSGRCNASERKRPHSRVLYLVLFDTSLEIVSLTLYLKNVNKTKFLDGAVAMEKK